MIEFYCENIEIPSNNTYYRKNRNMMMISEKGRIFKNEIQYILKSLNYEKIIGDVEIDISIGRKRDMDIDNMLKGLFDSIKDILIEDDKMIKKMTVEKHKVKIPFISLKIKKHIRS